MAVFPLEESSSRFPGSSPGAMPSRRMNTAARSFTAPPGLSHSALRRSSTAPRWNAGTAMSGVLPTAPHSGGSAARVSRSSAAAVRRAAVFTAAPALASRRPLGDRGADQIPPFGPRAVVVAHLFHAQQILEREPGVARALPDAAVGDHLVLAVDHLGALVQLQEVLVRLEGAVGGHGLAPRDVAGAGHVAGALRRLAHARGPDGVTHDIGRGAHVDQGDRLRLHALLHAGPFR